MPKYWNDPDEISSAINEVRRAASRAIATTDDEGYFQIVGPIKGMLIRGGENILPRWIEDFIHIHTAIEPVSAPDDRYREDVCARIKLSLGS